MTDTHFVEPGHVLYGKSPQKHLACAVKEINRIHADAEMVVITGDLAHLGQEDAYADLKATLAGLKMPCHLVIGNHDNRKALAGCFPSLLRDEHGFVQYCIEIKAGVFIMLDTKQENTHRGTLCSDRLHWLARQFAIYSDRPKYLFMHHAPFATMLPCIDSIGLENSDALGDLIEDTPSVRHIFCGHAHRPMSGSWRGVPVSGLRGLNHQVVLDFRSDREIIPLSFEQPQYGVCFIDSGAVLVHYHDFLDTESRFLMDDYEASIDREEAGSADFTETE